MEPMMMRLNGGLNLEKLKWLRKMKSKKNRKKMDGANFLQRNCRLDFTTRNNGRKKIQHVLR